MPTGRNNTNKWRAGAARTLPQCPHNRRGDCNVAAPSGHSTRGPPSARPATARRATERQKPCAAIQQHSRPDPSPLLHRPAVNAGISTTLLSRAVGPQSPNECPGRPGHHPRAFVARRLRDGTKGNVRHKKASRWPLSCRCHHVAAHYQCGRCGRKWRTTGENKRAVCLQASLSIFHTQRDEALKS